MLAYLQINSFNLQRTSLSLIVFAIRKATHGGDGRALWCLGDLTTCLWVLRRISYTYSMLDDM